MSSKIDEHYSSLLERSKELRVLMSAGSILGWDMQTKMPPRGLELKSQQLALLQKIGHQMLTSPELGKTLDSIEKHKDYESLTEVQKRNVHLARRAYDEATKLPERLVVELAKQRTIGRGVWRKAKATNDWKLFMPELEKVKALKAESASLLMEVKDATNPYDALIYDYEPKMKAETITKIFDEMRRGIKRLLDKIMAQPKPDVGFLSREVPVSVQEKIAESLAEFALYDTKSENAGGRIDATEHPFTTGYYTDVRITTKYFVDNFQKSMFSTLHEIGHAHYGMGLPAEWMYQPVGAGASSGIHESMSRFVENHVGRSREFWDHFMPELKRLTGKRLRDVSPEQMYAAVNYVTPSKIRTQSDELTYGMHIIIRFELERDLFNGDLEVRELPQVWGQKYMDYLGVEIETDTEGVMQDTHWSGGSFGYFPSYALGNIYDGVWRAKIDGDLPDWKEKLRKGSFGEVKDWLTENVYRHGKLYEPEELVKRVTGRGLVVKPFMDYLEAKYKAIYGF
ncbi:carboxypeptidase M32 [Candidatus Bathyarchaeota archaeon]|nr:MAG: carboxypeptidase M32 [Candidatus Bathyarchaeota archaeon]